ncbi:hypothetical protein FJT64_006499 [Amphibalanus amphitrite]|uniref:Uncharacterized protein n=1 Tax=Amphibalanus amphitrite TaxID=1232801 RepID=A0A6A4VPB0_AMPAM|nr:hypothetical protein FJT64_006499 [Amphibalanus amphitrite]
MYQWTVVVLMCSAVAGTSRTGDGSAPAAPHQPAARPADGSSVPSDTKLGNDPDINRNNLFGITCARGLVRINGVCVHTRTAQPAPLPPGLADGGPEYDDVDDDDFLTQLGVDPDSLPPVVGGPVAMVPVPSVSPDPADVTPSVDEFLDSLSDEEFLRELLADSERADPPPAPCSGRGLFRRGVVLVAVGSALLALAVAVAAWTVVRRRRRCGRREVTV